ncbi:hypothetical protein CMV_027150 [Castanea mollissima]|uniref:Uncharacterized protein n=1 Tax=Castanea mollissima TaxID=60419 RepID=A0A8J4VDI6_9ROSI|nr:hypothetical protein CMV_027150 [Castanea mollissima]
MPVRASLHQSSVAWYWGTSPRDTPGTYRRGLATRGVLEISTPRAPHRTSAVERTPEMGDHQKVDLGSEDASGLPPAQVPWNRTSQRVRIPYVAGQAPSVKLLRRVGLFGNAALNGR